MHTVHGWRRSVAIALAAMVGGLGLPGIANADATGADKSAPSHKAQVHKSGHRKAHGKKHAAKHRKAGKSATHRHRGHKKTTGGTTK